MSTPPPNLPSYMSESVFRTYEYVIAEVVNRWPAVSVIDPKEYNLPKSINTCESRLRCAFQSYEQYGWTSNVINNKAFLSIWALEGCPTVATRTDGDKSVLLVGRRADVRKEKTVPQEAPRKKQSTDVLVMPKLPKEEVQIVLHLAHNRALCRPVKLILTQEQVNFFEEMFDIAFDPQDDGTFLLL